MNQHRCETCKNCSKNPNDDYFCLVMNDEIDFTDFEHTAKVGCASHSSFQSDRDTIEELTILRNILALQKENENEVRKGKRDKVLDNLKTGIIKDLIACSFVVPDYPYVRKECISLYDAEEIVKQKIGEELRQKAGEP